MNNGNVLKKIFTIGRSSSFVAESFVTNWKFGLVEHIRLSKQPSYLFKYKSQNGSQDEFLSIFVIDSDIESLFLSKSIISQLHNAVNCVIFVLTETALTSKQLEILVEIDKFGLNSRAKIVSNDSLCNILECYGHIQCGFSYTCLDFDDIDGWLHSGTHFLSTGILIDKAIQNELPYMFYLQIIELKERYEILDLEVTGINVVFLGACISIELFDASLTMITGRFGLDLESSAHSNIHHSDKNEEVGFRIFASLKKKAPQSQVGVNDIPAFLRS